MGLIVTIKDIDAASKDDKKNKNSNDDELDDEEESDEVTEEKVAKGKRKYKKIRLTDFTITKYNKRLDESEGKNEYLEKDLLGIELYGKINVYDKSKEILAVNDLAKWSKVTAHEKEAYKDVKVKFFDNNNVVYDKMHFKNGFIVEYKESFDYKQGNGEFYVFIREFRDKIKEAKKVEKTGKKAGSAGTIDTGYTYYNTRVFDNEEEDKAVSGVLVAVPDDNKKYADKTTPCYMQYYYKYQFSNQSTVRNEKTEDLKSYIYCFDNNLPIYDSKKDKYVIDTHKYSNNTIELIQHYMLFKAELILRKYDSIMNQHYKNWLSNGISDDITTDFMNLCSENLNLIVSIKNKFMSKSERNSAEFIFGDLFFVDLVYTNHIWDFKNREVQISLSEKDKQQLISKAGETAFKKALINEVYLGFNQMAYNLKIEPYGRNSYIFNGQIRNRDYYGNFHFGYVGYTYYSYEKDPLKKILDGANLAQKLNPGTLGQGDPSEDIEAIKDGARANPYYWILWA